MNNPGRVPLFIDTGAFFARTSTRDSHHDAAKRLFNLFRASDSRFRPLVTSEIVLAELSSLLTSRFGAQRAYRTVSSILKSSSVNVAPMKHRVFSRSMEQFGQYTDHPIDIVDHTSAVLAEERDIDHIFTFDSDFRTLGFTVVPADVSPTNA